MYKNAETFYFKAVTPIHAGTGQDLGIVDMPIQRESHTNIPKIEASSLKGSIKQQLLIANNGERVNIERLLGKDKDNDKASIISITDAKLLFFPVRSAINVYSLITCPFVLKRYYDDLEFTCTNDQNRIKLSNFIEQLEKCIPLDTGEYLSFKDNKNDEKMYLEEYEYIAKNPNIELKEKFINSFKGTFEHLLKENIKRVLILSDEDFIDMVSMYTEIITRNKIDIETGVAKGTALFQEEYLPAESILYFIALAREEFKESKANNGLNDLNDLNEFSKFLEKENYFQVGGNGTIGKGFIKLLKV